MFKKQVNIIEATYPPINKQDWWFDTNTRKLKIFEKGTWQTLSLGSSNDDSSDLPESNNSLLPMPPNNEIWMLYDDEPAEWPDEEYVKRAYYNFGDNEDLEVINVEFVNNYYIYKDIHGNEEDGEYDEYTYTLIKVQFNQEIPSSLFFEEENSFEVPYGGCIWIKFPECVTTIESYRGITLIWDYPCSFIFGSNLSKLEGTIFNDDHDDIASQIICLSPNPPSLSSNNGFDYVFVPDESINKYKTATNWSNYSILGINSFLYDIYKV